MKGLMVGLALLVSFAATCSVTVAVRWWTYVRSPLPDALAYLGPAPATDVVELDREVNRLGMKNSPFADVRGQQIDSSLRVIGVVINGQAYAYSVKALSILPDKRFTDDVLELARRHVVNQLIGDTAVCVTYCDITGCARVFRMDHQTRELPIVVGGMSNRQLVLS